MPSSKTIVASEIPQSQHLRAIQNAVAEFDEVYLAGTFELGEGTVMLTRGVTIRGVRTQFPPQPPQTTCIRGGGEKLPLAELGNTHSGAFKVVNQGSTAGGNDKPVVIKDIVFRGWKGEAILAEHCRGLEVIGCDFTDPVPGDVDGISTELTFVHAIFAFGEGCQGHFVASLNSFSSADSYESIQPPDDDNFLACIRSSFQKIDIDGNSIDGRDDGIEVIANLTNPNDVPAADSTISITNNKPITLANLLDTSFYPPKGFGGHAAIVCVRNRNKTTVISGNDINAVGDVSSLVLSGDNLNVTGNTSTQEGATAFATILLGSNLSFTNISATAQGLLGLDNLGSLNASTISQNELSGCTRYAMVTMDWNDIAPDMGFPKPNPSLEPNSSHGNRISDNSLFGLQCVGPSIRLTSQTFDNQFVGCFQGYVNQGANTNRIFDTCSLLERLHNWILSRRPMPWEGPEATGVFARVAAWVNRLWRRKSRMTIPSGSHEPRPT